MRKNSTNYTDSVICRKCYHPKQKKMYKNPALFHLTEPLSKDTPARCSGILKHIHGSINFHFFFLQVQPVCYAVSDGKDSLSEKEVEKVPGNDYNKVK